MHWVIQDDLLRYESGLRFLAEHLPRWGIPHSLHRVVPIIGQLIPDISPEGNVIVIGSYSMRHVAREKGWVPGCFDVGHLQHEDFLVAWKQYMLNADCVVCSLQDAPHHFRDPSFVRPASDTKEFPARVYGREEFMEWCDKVQRMVDTAKPDERLDVTMEARLVISPPREIAQETRCWIVDRKLVTASVYRRYETVIHDSDVDEDVRAFAQSIAERAWQPHRAYVLDVGRVGDQLKVVEINTLNSAGFYAADMQKLVEAIEAMEFT
jgi:hypothetical protein